MIFKFLHIFPPIRKFLNVEEYKRRFLRNRRNIDSNFFSPTKNRLSVEKLCLNHIFFSLDVWGFEKKSSLINLIINCENENKFKNRFFRIFRETFWSKNWKLRCSIFILHQIELLSMNQKLPIFLWILPATSYLSLEFNIY